MTRPAGSPVSERGLSVPVILLSGVIAAVLLLATVFAIRSLSGRFAPTRRNIENLLTERKFDEALSLVESEGTSLGDSSDVYVMAGKIWMAHAWQKMNEDRWRSYGRNEDDWFDLPEANKAEQLLLRAIELDREHADAHYYLGMLYMEKGWFSSAEVEFLEVLKVKPDDIRTRQNLGVLYTKMRRLELAKRELLRAHKIAPENPSIMKNLSFLYRFYLGRPDSAMLWANRYMNINPDDDLDIGVVRQELEEMMDRYPDLVPEEPLRWKKPRRFKARERTPFTGD
ncbi:MAG: hypothetical protein GF418_16805 [Chitinivibrionales bacterium]|nr:hypothetical protein [Chitinivibrionales bacterium]MBD3397281.1 hypothetical protein [Chitinivibrionales bacterium]